MVGLLAAALVTYPWVRSGWVLVLDWARGPHQSLPAMGGIAAGDQPSLPVTALLQVIGDVVGSRTVSWLTISFALTLSAWAIARLMPGGIVAKATGAALYTLNPFIFERIGAGQTYVLLGYAVLPLVARSLLLAECRNGWQRLTPLLWIALATAISIHFLWISGVVVIGVVAYRRTRRSLIWGTEIVVGAALLTAYVLVPSILQHQTLSVGGSDLAAYHTTGDPRLGLFGNVLGLYGFWRNALVLPKDHFSGWPALMAAILVVVAAGAWTAKRDRSRRSLLGPLLVAAVIGYFLALGGQGPTGPLFRLLYFHLPGFNVMREPEKFSCLLALFYAPFFGLGVESLLGNLGSVRRLLLVIGALSLTVAYSFNIVGGLDGQVAASHYPSSWQKADRVMGAGPGKILVLPLHEYLAFPFTHGKVIANPGSVVFQHPVLVGGEVGARNLLSDSLSPENAYLAALVADNQKISRLGHLVAQLGVRYVVVVTGGDSYNYGWVARQQDLTRVFSSPEINVYRNDLALPVGARLMQGFTVPSTACYLQLAQRSDLVGTAVTVRPGPGPCSVPPGFTPTVPIADVHRRSAISYQAAAVKTMATGTIALPEDAVNSWVSSARSSVALAGGTVGVPAGRTPTTISFAHWQASVIADGFSILGVAVLLCGCFLTSRRNGARTSGLRHATTH